MTTNSLTPPNWLPANSASQSTFLHQTSLAGQSARRPAILALDVNAQYAVDSPYSFRLKKTSSENEIQSRLITLTPPAQLRSLLLILFGVWFWLSCADPCQNPAKNQP